MIESVNKVIDEARQGEAMVIESTGGERKLYLESHGCAMNFSDSEIIASIMSEHGFSTVKDFMDADVIFINTCAIRENAEQKIRNRLKEFKAAKKQNRELIVGVMGCMAERLKSKFLEEEKLVDLVVGPDAYRDLPKLIGKVEGGEKSVNVLLSREETYADITPVRLDSNGITAFISIMRGCDNMCSFCVVPFTRGRERSRDAHSIVAEAYDLVEKGYKEVTLLGQNVDSYKWSNEENTEHINFAQLLEMVALVNPGLRVRFSTSHPKDITDEVLYTIAKYDNICNYIHLPLQSGSSRMLELMNRTYNREWYMERVEAIRRILPECSISSDIISGFCTETENDHQETLNMIEWARFSFSYMYKYSERPGTLAARKYADDISEEVKSKRLDDIIAVQQKVSESLNMADVGKTFLVLAEKISKRSNAELAGRNSQNQMIIFPRGNYKPGDYVNVKITECSSATLKGIPVA